MKLRFLAFALVGVCLGISSCSKDEKVEKEPASAATITQPDPIKPDKEGWVRAGDTIKLKNGAVKMWKHGKAYLYSVFNLSDGGYSNGGVILGPSSTIYSLDQEDIGKPFINYNCKRGEWNLGKGKIIKSMIETYKDEVRTYLLVNGKYTGVKPWGFEPWPTTGYDPAKKKWKDQFVGKSAHGINQLTGNQAKFAELIAKSKEAVVVSGTEEKRVYFKFTFETPPDQMDKKQLCEFAIDGTAIVTAE